MRKPSTRTCFSISETAGCGGSDCLLLMLLSRYLRLLICQTSCANAPVTGRTESSCGRSKFMRRKRCRWHRLSTTAPIAQLDRASDYGSEGSRFNSWWVHHLKHTQAKGLVTDFDA